MMLSQPYQMPATTLNSMPQPQPVVNQSASNSQIYQDSSDSSDNDGRQTYTNSLVTPSFAYLNPMFVTQQGPNISHVSSKLQRKIQQNQYIDLAKLYRHDNPFEKEPVFTIMKNGHLKILSQPKNNDIYSFSRFLDCFMIYMTIRGKSHPQEYPGMLRYVEIVKNLFAQHCDGISYDRRFRMMRADNPNMPWSCYMAELVVRKPSQYPQDNPRPRSNTPTIPPPSSTPGSPKQSGKPYYCHFFNSGKCTRPVCKYPHMCSVCGERTHGKKTCTKKTGS